MDDPKLKAELSFDYDLLLLAISLPTYFLLAFAVIAPATVEAAAQERDVYVVLLHGSPVVHYDGSLAEFPAVPRREDGRADMTSESAQRYASFLVDKHDRVLESSLGPAESSSYAKLYSYHYLVNGFSALLTSEQAAALQRAPEVSWVEKDQRVQKQTTYTPRYMGLPSGAWADNGGEGSAGEGVVIGVVDTGVDPTHPSFSDKFGVSQQRQERPYQFPRRFTGACEVAQDFPPGSCNNKLVGARHFAAAVIASGAFNPRDDSASPFDGDGHGTHTAATAAGNSRVPVIIDGMNFGLASGIAPRAHLAIYKSLYRNVGGYFADTVAAIDQAVQDGVDILSLSIGPAQPPAGLATFFSAFDMAALSAAKAGVFVVQAAGNSGPLPGSIASFSPWIFTVGAAYHDRSYFNTILLGNKLSIQGFGLSPPTRGRHFYPLVLASSCVRKERLITDPQTCQNPDAYYKSLIRGRILVCTYTSDFLSGGSASMHRLLLTAKRQSARGVIILVDQSIADQVTFGPFPSALPAVLVPSVDDSTSLLAYSSNNRLRSSARILGGLEPTYSGRATQVAFYSARGPDLANDKRQIAEIMKPDAMAPGNMIWAAWSPKGNDDPNFSGCRFALVSGTSMAAPHVAGIAALVKQKNPKLSPAGIASALTTTASTADENGNPLLAQNPYYNVSLPLGPATPFDFGGGEVNPTAALDPGLVFDTGYSDYVDFLCSIRGAKAEVLNATGAECRAGSPEVSGADLNKPSLTVAHLKAERVFVREVTSVQAPSIRAAKDSAADVAESPEEYVVSVAAPEGVSVDVEPGRFVVAQGGTQRLVISLAPAGSASASSSSYDQQADVGDHEESARSAFPPPTWSFGSIDLRGSHGHHVRIPVSVRTQG